MSENEEPPIRSVIRALNVIKVMNTAQRLTLNELYIETKLPKSTLFRILATLQSEGYVAAEHSRGIYYLTSKIRELGAGFTEQSAIVSAGSEIVLRVTKQIKWPLAIGVLDGENMAVGYSTMPWSPLAIRSSTLGRRLSMYDTAMGLAYLAFSNSNVQKTFIDNALSVNMDDNDLWHNLFTKRLERIISQGYAVRKPKNPGESASLAVPILVNEEAAASLGMTTFGKLMNQKTIDQYLPILQETAKEIAIAYNGLKQ